MRLAAALLAAFLLCTTAARAAGVSTNAAPHPEPFLHMYREALDGGSQEVVADTIVPSAQVATLRRTLRAQAARYTRGDYPTPDGNTVAAARLHAGAQHIVVLYSDVPRGGRIVFKTNDKSLVSALHDWMAATVRVEQQRHKDGGPGQQTG